MTYDEFRTTALELCHPLHTAQIASMFMCTIDDLIADAYAGEIDELDDSTPESFVRYIDSTYAHLVH
jgi:hypothetical protein